MSARARCERFDKKKGKMTRKIRDERPTVAAYLKSVERQMETVMRHRFALLLDGETTKMMCSIKGGLKGPASGCISIHAVKIYQERRVFGHILPVIRIAPNASF